MHEMVKIELYLWHCDALESSTGTVSWPFIKGSIRKEPGRTVCWKASTHRAVLHKNSMDSSLTHPPIFNRGYGNPHSVLLSWKTQKANDASWSPRVLGFTRPLPKVGKVVKDSWERGDCPMELPVSCAQSFRGSVSWAITHAGRSFWLPLSHHAPRSQ